MYGSLWDLATDRDLIDQVTAAEREVARLHAVQAQMIAELSRRRMALWHADMEQAETLGAGAGPQRGQAAAVDDASDEVGLALCLSPGTASRRVGAAVALVERLPTTLAALAGGALDWSRASHLALETQCLPRWVARVVEDQVLGPLRGDDRVVLTRAQLGRAVRRAIAAADPAAAAVHHDQQVEQRAVWVEPLPDAMARLCVQGPAPQVLTLYEAITAMARTECEPSDLPTEDTPTQPPEPDDRPLREIFDAAEARSAARYGHPDRPVDTRRVGARRFDALVAMAAAVLADPNRHLATTQGQRPHIQVTIAATTLIGADDCPADLAGYGPLPAQIGRELAAIGIWRPLVTDPATGALLDYGRTQYRPPAALRDFVLARDTTCIQPTCARSSHRTQIDHLQAYSDGGTTDPANHGPQCVRHHLIKTHRPHWAVRRLPDGSIAWTTPTAHTYLRPHDPTATAEPPWDDTDDPAERSSSTPPVEAPPEPDQPDPFAGPPPY